MLGERLRRIAVHHGAVGVLVDDDPLGTIGLLIDLEPGDGVPTHEFNLYVVGDANALGVDDVDHAAGMINSNGDREQGGEHKTGDAAAGARGPDYRG